MHQKYKKPSVLCSQPSCFFTTQKDERASVSILSIIFFSSGEKQKKTTFHITQSLSAGTDILIPFPNIFVPVSTAAKKTEINA